MKATSLAIVALSLMAQPVAASSPRQVSVTWSPLLLVFPMVELTGELLVADGLSAALIIAAGKVTPIGADETFPVAEFGVQARYYVVGDFEHGMHLGAEVIGMFLDRDGVASEAAHGEGIAMGPFVGYKLMLDVGFTLDAQLGAQYVAARPKNGMVIVPLVNLSLGWSF